MGPKPFPYGVAFFIQNTDDKDNDNRNQNNSNVLCVYGQGLQGIRIQGGEVEIRYHFLEHGKTGTESRSAEK